MARKSHRASRTRKHHARKHSTRQRSQRKQRRTRRHRGGACALTGAPLSDNLAGGWSSKMSMGQGGDYLKYHMGQHGGYLAGAPLRVLGNEGLPASMQSSAMTASTMKAYADVSGLKDQAGGRRKHKKHSKRQRSKRQHSKRQHSKRQRSKRSKRSNRSKKQRGGSKLDFAPFPSSGMLLSDYSKTGMSPQWNGGVEFDGAAARQAM